MRQFTLVLSFMLGILVELCSQNCAPNGIKTDPNAPVNNQRPSMRNSFDYTAQNFPLNLETTQYQTNQINSPFYTTDNSNIGHFYDPNDGIRENTPEQGWELIKMDFGFDENGNPRSPGVTNPYLVLYNRYTGILRAFVARVESQPFNGALFKFEFLEGTPMQTSLLDHNAELQSLADPFTKDPELNSLAEFLTLPFKWFYADFPMIYDPCTCLFESKLSIDVQLTNTVEINATSTTTGSIATQGKPTSSQDGKGAFAIGALGSKTKAAIQLYKGTNLFKNDIQKYLSSSGPKPTEQDKFYYFYDNLRKNNFLKNGLKAIPYIEDAINILDFFTGGGKKGSSQLEIAPLSVDLKSSFTGTARGTYRYNTISFRTPGSQIPSLSPNSEYPYYNEVMGIFNLLKTPRLSMKQYIKQGSGYGGSGGYTLQSFFRLEEDIQYVVNPASGLEVQEIEMAILGDGQFSWLNGSNSGYGLKLADAGYSNIRGRNEYRTPYRSIGCFKQSVLKLERSASGFNDYVDLQSSRLRIKVMVNLRRKEGGANAQNVMFVATYPLELSTKYGISNSEANSLNYASYGFANCGSWNVPAQVSKSAVQSFCLSPDYKQSARGFKDGEYEAKVTALLEEELKQADGNRTAQSHLPEFTIFPNPSSDMIKLNYRNSDGNVLSVYVTDLIGKSVLQLAEKQDFTGSISQSFDVSTLSPGMYFLVVETSGNKEIKKFEIR